MYRSTRILSTSDRLERLETLLGHLTANWDGLLILTGDMNIDMLQPANSLTIQYQATLDVLGLQQMLKQPTRITKTSKTLTDHVVTNYPHRIKNTGVIRCSTVSDHDGIFACANVRVPRFQPRYKYIRNEKCFDENAFKHDFFTLTLSIVYAVESPNEMVDLLNTLIVECLHRQAHLNRVKITRPRGYIQLISDGYKLRERNSDWMPTLRMMMNHGLLLGLSVTRLRWLLVSKEVFFNDGPLLKTP